MATDRPTYAQSHLLRIGRWSQTGGIYLVTTTTHRRRPLFRDVKAGRLVVRALQTEQHAATTLCYVLMPDHLHWLMALRGDATLPEVMQRVKSVTGHALARAHQLTGRAWQPGYHDRALRREDDIRAVARYVVANPLRAGLVKRIGDYPLWDAAWL
jgi:REP element-mobilizing transposase RayT